MTAAERLANAIRLNDELTALQRQVSVVRKYAIDELQAAKQEAERRLDEMPTNVQPERTGVQ